MTQLLTIPVDLIDPSPEQSRTDWGDLAGLCRLDYAVHRRTGRCIAAHRLRDADGYGLVTSSLRGHAATVRRLPMETLAGATESDVDAWIAEDGAAADGQSAPPAAR